MRRAAKPKITAAIRNVLGSGICWGWMLWTVAGVTGGVSCCGETVGATNRVSAGASLGW